MIKRNIDTLNTIFHFFLVITIIVMCTDIKDVHAATNTEDVISMTDEVTAKLEEIQDKVKEKIKIKEIKATKKMIKQPEKTRVAVCGIDTTTKSYEDGAMLTNVNSPQWDLLQKMQINKNGIYTTKDGYLGVALGSIYGNIGTKYEIELQSGKTLKVIKLDEKADVDTVNGCYHKSDGSMLEFVIDTATAAKNYGIAENGYVLSGNFNNHSDYNGAIIKMSKVIE